MHFWVSYILFILCFLIQIFDCFLYSLFYPMSLYYGLPRCLHGKEKSESRSVVSDSVTPWIVTCQAPLSMKFSRQEYCSGLPFPSPGELPHPGIEPRSSRIARALQEDSGLGHQGSPQWQSARNAGDMGLIPGSGRSLEEKGNPH